MIRLHKFRNPTYDQIGVNKEENLEGNDYLLIEKSSEVSRSAAELFKKEWASFGAKLAIGKQEQAAMEGLGTHSVNGDMAQASR